MIKIGLFWHDFPSENLGVGALTYSHLLLLQRAAGRLGEDVEFSLFGMDPEESSMLQEATSAPVSYTRLSFRKMLLETGYLRKLLWKVHSCDILFDLSAGDSFTDIYGVKRLLQQCFTKLAALGCRKPLVLSPQTVGPFDSRFGRILSGFILKRARRVFVRDNLSLEYLERAGLGGNAEMVTDLAFALPYDRTLYSFEPGRLHVGVNVSGLLFNGGYNRANQFAMKFDYPSFVRSLITRLAQHPGCTVHLVPHVISELYQVEDDYRACELLGSEYTDCVVAPRFTTPLEAKSYISNLEFFTGARMHATIAAFSSGVPVVPVAYSRKFAGLYGSLGYHHLVDGKMQSCEEALEIVLGGVERREELAGELRVSQDLALRRLEAYVSFLTGALGRVQRA